MATYSAVRYEGITILADGVGSRLEISEWPCSSEYSLSGVNPKYFLSLSFYFPKGGKDLNTSTGLVKSSSKSASFFIARAVIFPRRSLHSEFFLKKKANIIILLITSKDISLKDIERHWKTSTAIKKRHWKAIRRCQKASKGKERHRKASKDIKKHWKTLKNIERHQNTSKDIKTHRKASKHSKTHQNTLKHIETHWSTLKHFETHQFEKISSKNKGRKNKKERRTPHGTVHHNMCIWGGFQWMVLGIIKTKVVISVYEASCTRDSSSTLNTLLQFLYVTLVLVVLSVNIKARSIVLRMNTHQWLLDFMGVFMAMEITYKCLLKLCTLT